MDIKIKNVEFNYEWMKCIPVGDLFVFHSELYIRTIAHIRNVGNCIKMSDGTMHTIDDNAVIQHISRSAIAKIKIKGDY